MNGRDSAVKVLRLKLSCYLWHVSLGRPGAVVQRQQPVCFTVIASARPSSSDSPPPPIPHRVPGRFECGSNSRPPLTNCSFPLVVTITASIKGFWPPLYLEELVCLTEADDRFPPLSGRNSPVFPPVSLLQNSRRFILLFSSAANALNYCFFFFFFC